jgi:sugar porter (SP) family MFS transporter
MAEQLEFEHSNSRQFRPYNIFMILLMSLGSIGYGYNASIIATTLAQPSFIRYFELDTRPDGTELIATTNGLYQAGGFLAVFSVSWLADRWGRRFAIGVSALLNLISGAGLTGSVHIGMFIFFRFLAGAGAFMIVAAVPIWMNEVVPPSVRGVLVDCHCVGLLIGYTSATVVGYGFFHLPADNNGGWRGPLSFQCLPVALLLMGIYWMPESPRWLISQDRIEEAEKVLNKLHAPEEARIELQQIRTAIDVDRHLEKSWWSMFSKRSYRKRSFLAMGMAASIQTSGILVVNNYGPTIYGSLGFDTNKQLIYQIGWCCTALGTGIMSFFIIDRFRRPTLLSLGVGGCASCLVILCALIGKYASSPEKLENPNRTALNAAVGMIYLLTAFYQLGLDGVQFAYLGELFPNQIRAKGMVLGIATICGMNIMWLQTAPIAFQEVGWKFYICFFVPGLIAATIIWFYFPDTLGVPLEEVAKLFGDHDELFGSEAIAQEKSRNSEEFGKQDISSHVETASV